MTPDPRFMPERARLERDVRALAVPRHPRAAPRALQDAEDYVAGQLAATGMAVSREAFAFRGRRHHNVVATHAGTDADRPRVIVGAHFDSVAGSPGADDNASGVAGMLEIARLLAPLRPAATIVCVGFNLEEIQDALLSYKVGSRHYAAGLKSRGVRVAGALVLEMIGYTGPSQTVPAAVQLVKEVPRTGDFLAAVGDGNSGALLHAMEHAATGLVPLVSLTVPLKGWLVPDTRRSDNARFWDHGFPSLMITDTADLRNPHYHRASDTPDTLDFAFMTRVVEATARCAWAVANALPAP